MHKKADTLMEGVEKINERIMVSRDEVQGLRTDSVDAIRDMEKRLEQMQNALDQSQTALVQSQHEKAELQAALKDSSDHLTAEQNKNYRQAMVLARLNAELTNLRAALRVSDDAKTNFEVELARAKVELNGLRNMQTLQANIQAMKAMLEHMQHMQPDVQSIKNALQTMETNTGCMLERIHAQGVETVNMVQHVKLMQEVALAGDADGNKKRRLEDDA